MLGGRGTQAQQATGVGQEGMTGQRQAYIAAVAIKKRDVQVVLQQLDLPAQRRLRHVQPLRRAAEMEFLGDRDEAA